MATKKVQYTVTILPENATDKEITWWVENITGTAEIDQQGLLTPLAIGEIKIHAALKSNPTINDSLLVAIEKMKIALRTKDGKILRDKNLSILVIR